MENLSDDELGCVLMNVLDPRDRKSCSTVCKQWRRVEGLSRASLCVLDARFLRCFLPRYRNLRSLRAGGFLSDTDLSFIAETCPGLRELYLNHVRASVPLDDLDDHERFSFGDQGLLAVAVRCKELCVVHLKKRWGVGDASVSCLVESSKRLTVLNLSNCSHVSDCALVAIGQSAYSLQELYLRGCHSITDDGLIALAAGSLRHALKILDLCDCDRITDVGILQLKTMVSLEELNLADCGLNITDVGGVAFAEMQGLRRLNLSWLSKLSDETITVIAKKCLNLAVLDVTGCELVSGAGLRHFVGSKSLEVLRAVSCNISVDDVTGLILGCQSLKYFGLDISLRVWIPPSFQRWLGELCCLVWV